MIVKVKRQDKPDTKSYWQSFEYNVGDNNTVAGILDYLNFSDDLKDINGEKCRRINWECSCMQKMCGACAMVVNHEPVLACSKFIDTKKMKTLTIEPLTKFPVLVDLHVDRSIIFEYMKEAEIYIGKLGAFKEKEFENQYSTAKCLKCGLCLEVCPNYTGVESKFYGATFANESYLTHSLSENRQKEIAASYKKHFMKGCSKSLACRNICPANIPTLSSIGYMNRK